MQAAQRSPGTLNDVTAQGSPTKVGVGAVTP
jgi:hypothetical protein